MRILKLAELLSTLTSYRIFALNFPELDKGNSAVKMEITSGVNEVGGVFDFNIQIMVKATTPAESEGIASDVITKLNNKTNKLYDNNTYQLILCKASSPEPFFVGVDEQEHYIFSTEFRLLITKL